MMLVRRNQRRAPPVWERAMSISVGVSVAFSVLLVSVAFGVHSEISRTLSSPLVRRSGLVDVSHIDSILVSLTLIVTLGMMAQTAAATFVLGVTSMRLRREEIALRRQSGVLRSTLLVEFVSVVLGVCLIGGVIGELIGAGLAMILSHVTVLPIEFNLVSLGAAFPVTVLLAVAATLIPAWQASGASPALLRKE